MGSIPFTIYDFLGYLAAGVALLVVVDYAFDLHWLILSDAALAVVVFWAVAAYATGQIVANIAGFVLERGFVRRVLRSPEETLYWTDRERWQRERWRRLFPGHHDALPLETQKRIEARAGRVGFERFEDRRALFFHAFAVVQRDEAIRARLDRFIVLYGFCRNACMAALLASLVVLAALLSHWVADSEIGDHLEVAFVAALLAAIGLFYRYLKFFRDYTTDVLRFYAEMPVDGM